MNKLSSKIKGFTLVELLVVITIMGILATGSTAMFTGAQQKARDSVRITDLQAVRLALEQYYGDYAEYPQANSNALNPLLESNYIDRIPSDPKTGQANNNTMFYYLYASAQEPNNQIRGQIFEISAAFENQGNLNSKANNDTDSGNDNHRWEIGIYVDKINSYLDQNGSVPTEKTNTYSPSSTDNEPLVIDRNVIPSNL